MIKIYDNLKINIFTCSCWASVENGLLWRCASRSSLLYSGFRYNIELPMQLYKIQLYTFRVQGLAFFLPWYPNYKGNRKIFLKHRPPRVLIYPFERMCVLIFHMISVKRLLGLGGGGGGWGGVSYSPKRGFLGAQILAFGFLVCSPENLFPPL